MTKNEIVEALLKLRDMTAHTDGSADLRNRAAKSAAYDNALTMIQAMEDAPEEAELVKETKRANALAAELLEADERVKQMEAQLHEAKLENDALYNFMEYMGGHGNVHDLAKKLQAASDDNAKLEAKLYEREATIIWRAEEKLRRETARANDKDLEIAGLKAQIGHITKEAESANARADQAHEIIEGLQAYRQAREAHVAAVEEQLLACRASKRG